MDQPSINEICQEVHIAVDYAFSGKFKLNLYSYFKTLGIKRDRVKEFMISSAAQEVSFTVKDLEEYLEGGSDSAHKQLREGYGHIPKPEARKIKNYLNKMLDDAEKYYYDKRPGRRAKQSK